MGIAYFIPPILLLEMACVYPPGVLANEFETKRLNFCSRCYL